MRFCTTNTSSTLQPAYSIYIWETIWLCNPAFKVDDGQPLVTAAVWQNRVDQTKTSKISVLSTICKGAYQPCGYATCMAISAQLSLDPSGIFFFSDAKHASQQ